MIVPREHGTSRLEAFSDGMLAVAATLLVVSLEVPRTHAELLDDIYGFAPFALSFAALFFIWVVHTNLFRRYPLRDPVSVILNGILLFTVLFYVFPLRFLATALLSLLTGENQVALDDLIDEAVTGKPREQVIQSATELQNIFIIYGIGWILVFGCFALMYFRAHALREELGLTAVQAYDAVTHGRHYVGFVVAGVISVTLAILGVGIPFGLPGFAYAVIGILAWWNAAARQKERDALAETLAEHPSLADTRESPAVPTPHGRRR